EGWRIPDLKGYARQNRPALAVAALTILKAHAAAGRPQADLPAFGSFEAWSAAVRQPIYWATEHDPHAARSVLVPQTRNDLAILAAVLDGWSHLPGGRNPKEGVTAKRALEIATETSEGGPPHDDLREALIAWDKNGVLPDKNALGYLLRAAKDRVAGGCN